MSSDVLGVDIGGVIIDRVNDNTDTSFFSDNYLLTTATPGCFEALRRLRDERFGNQIHLVSKCGRRIQEKTLHWLEHHKFYERTGILIDHVHFCRNRSGKAPICDELGITHFIDDRLEVLGYLERVEELYLFQPNAQEVTEFSHFLPLVTHVESWNEVLKHLLS